VTQGVFWIGLFYFALEVKSMHFSRVKASLTELRRETGRILGAVIRGQRAVELTQYGETAANIQPHAKPITGAEFARRWKNRRPLGKATARQIVAASKSMDQAG
jgi:antitoxin (DNA-binding transcriptional repressor) of toxin-antitoxin stability system